MTIRHTGPLLALFLTLALAGCSPEESAQAPAQPPAPAAAAQPALTTAAQPGAASTAGLTWDVPDSWQAQGQRPMRAATYNTPPAEGDTDPGEVAVFYFGPSEGGTVSANVDRWFNQFDQEDGRPTREVAESETIEVDSMQVTIVRASGAYNAAAGPMAPRADVRPGYALIGAIAEGPQGAVFFKFTGPEATVRAEEARFIAMVESIRRI
jgi:hypothetical protein